MSDTTAKQKWIVTTTYQTRVEVTVEANSQLEAIQAADRDWINGKTNESTVPHSMKPWRAKKQPATA